MALVFGGNELFLLVAVLCFRQLQMENRIRLAYTVCFISAYDPESHAEIKSERFFVLLVYVYFIHLFSPGGVFQQSSAISFSLFAGAYEQHFDEFVAQSHKGDNLSIGIADDIQFYSR